MVSVRDRFRSAAEKTKRLLELKRKAQEELARRIVAGGRSAASKVRSLNERRKQVTARNQALLRQQREKARQTRQSNLAKIKAEAKRRALISIRKIKGLNERRKQALVVKRKVDIKLARKVAEPIRRSVISVTGGAQKQAQKTSGLTNLTGKSKIITKAQEFRGEPLDNKVNKTAPIEIKFDQGVRQGNLEFGKGFVGETGLILRNPIIYYSNEQIGDIKNLAEAPRDTLKATIDYAFKHPERYSSEVLAELIIFGVALNYGGIPSVKVLYKASKGLVNARKKIKASTRKIPVSTQTKVVLSSWSELGRILEKKTAKKTGSNVLGALIRIVLEVPGRVTKVGGKVVVPIIRYVEKFTKNNKVKTEIATNLVLLGPSIAKTKTQKANLNSNVNALRQSAKNGKTSGSALITSLTGNKGKSSSSQTSSTKGSGTGKTTTTKGTSGKGTSGKGGTTTKTTTTTKGKGTSSTTQKGGSSYAGKGKPKTETKGKGKPETKSKPKTKAKSKPKQKVKVKTKSKFKIKTKVKAKQRLKLKTKQKVKTKTKQKVKPKQKLKLKLKLKSPKKKGIKGSPVSLKLSTRTKATKHKTFRKARTRAESHLINTQGKQTAKIRVRGKKKFIPKPLKKKKPQLKYKTGPKRKRLKISEK